MDIWIRVSGTLSLPYDHHGDQKRVPDPISSPAPKYPPILYSAYALPKAPLNILDDVAYTWNYNGQLTGVSRSGTENLYNYDYAGNRVRAIVNSSGITTATTYYPNKYYEKSGSDVTKYIYAGGVLISTVKKSGGTTTVSFIHSDHLGSTSAVTDSSGAVLQSMDYYPFGSERICSGVSCSAEKRYIGEYYDVDTTLNYLNARYYDSSLGRFISEDSMFWNPEKLLQDPQSMNAYAYSRNNPIKNLDQDGKWYKEFIWDNIKTFGHGQSWSSFSSEVGQATMNMGSGWQTAMDHPYIAGATVGVVGGMAAVGGAAIVESGVLSTASRLLFNPKAVIRGTVNTVFNVSNQIMEDEMQNKQTSLGDYSKIVGLSYTGGALIDTKSVTLGASFFGGLNALTQGVTGDHKIDFIKVGAAALGGGFGTWAANSLSEASGLATYTAQQFGTAKIGSVLEMPISIIRSGLSE